jgi:hypothetical protein
MKSPLVHVVNPLPLALAHYEAALIDNLVAAGADIRRVETTSMEVAAGGATNKALSIVRSVAERCGFLRARRGLVVCLWPGFGLLEPLTWILAMLKHDVVVVYHDPVPIRRQAGYSRTAQRFFTVCVRRMARFHVVVHTELARTDMANINGVQAALAYHPILPRDVTRPPTSTPGPVTVLGQFKPERTLKPLEDIAALQERRPSGLLIRGRGWPKVPGWEVDDTFLTEQEFDASIDLAVCVIVPYARFYQSGVATRCLEGGTPVVAPRHEHIEWLFGTDWPGLVDDDDWAAALDRVLERAIELGGRSASVRLEAVDSWAQLVREIRS